MADTPPCYVGGVLSYNGSMPFITYILAVGFVVAAIASTVHNALNEKTDTRGFGSYFVFSLIGAVVGAFLAFGDAPFLLRFPVLNPFTLSVVGSLVLTGIAVVVTTKRQKGRRKISPGTGHEPPPIFKK